MPELRDVPASAIHEPWRMTPADREHAGCADYPRPIPGTRYTGGAFLLSVQSRRDDMAVLQHGLDKPAHPACVASAHICYLRLRPDGRQTKSLALICTYCHRVSLSARYGLRQCR